MTAAKSCPRPPRRRLLRAITACSAAAALPALAASGNGEVGIGGTLREATLRGLNGPSRRLSSFRGKPLLINVWASWCGPCREEAASLERLAWGSLAGRFNLIGISTDDYPDNALEWLRNTASWPLGRLTLWGPEGFEAREPDELPVVRVKHERRVGRPSRPRFRPPFRPPASACT